MNEPNVLCNKKDLHLIKYDSGKPNITNPLIEEFTDEEFYYIFDNCTGDTYESENISYEDLDNPNYIDITKPNWFYIHGTAYKYFPDYLDAEKKLQYFYELCGNDPIICKYFRRLYHLYGLYFDYHLELHNDDLINHKAFYRYFKLEPNGSINQIF
ncbi:MAG: hypothetical protein K2M17_00280 [Bacilli bacterium]|nr:hypothetical protein [Bacilli bacterium]